MIHQHGLSKFSEPSYDDGISRYLQGPRSVQQKALKDSAASVQQILDLMEKGSATNSAESS